MIRPLRRFHFAYMLTLALALSALLASVALRRAPVARAKDTAPANHFALHSKAGSFSAQLSPDQLKVSLHADKPNIAADPLVYWTTQTEVSNIESASFLGSFSEGRQYAFPKRNGLLVIYSLPEHRVIDTIEVGGGQ